MDDLGEDMKLRDSRFELLRIASMFMIVISHFAVYGNWDDISSISAIDTTRILVLDILGPNRCSDLFYDYWLFSQ